MQNENHRQDLLNDTEDKMIIPDKTYGESPIPLRNPDHMGKVSAVREYFAPVRPEKTSISGHLYTSGSSPEKRHDSAGEGFKSDVPDRIIQMRELYEYGGTLFSRKCRNFYVQGKFMEDYEDNAPWDGNFFQYFPTYQDLNIRQLRGYFTWRTYLRRGEYRQTSISFAYIYLYELLNGIGVSSPENALEKMETFEKMFIDAGFGDYRMRQNLHRWMFEFSVLNGFSPEIARKYDDPDRLKMENALEALKDPGRHSDEEVFAGLSYLYGSKLSASPVITKDRERGARLFASFWRAALTGEEQKGQDIFKECFGEKRTFSFHPLENAVHWEEENHADTVYELNECRTYTCSGGDWTVARYNSLYFNKDMLYLLIHEADRIFRKTYKTGHYLRKTHIFGWASEYALKAVADERRAEEEASRPVINIDFSELKQIREDAAVTRDSLLTEEETDDTAGAVMDGTIVDDDTKDSTDAEDSFLSAAAGETGKAADIHSGTDEPAPDAMTVEVIRALLNGKPAEPIIAQAHIMPSVAADRINEYFFDEIGDSVVEYDGNRISLVEEYREDLSLIISGA